MKYVRTKQGRVIDLVDYQKEFGCMFYLPYDEIIKYSDTIEELCDYVLYRTFGNQLVVRDLPLSTSWESLIRDMRYGLLKDVKLAILTDKGLIYVAKINKKGELELI